MQVELVVGASSSLSTHPVLGAEFLRARLEVRALHLGSNSPPHVVAHLELENVAREWIYGGCRYGIATGLDAGHWVPSGGRRGTVCRPIDQCTVEIRRRVYRFGDYIGTVDNISGGHDGT